MDISIVYAVVVGGSLSLFLVRSLLLVSAAIANSTKTASWKARIIDPIVARRGRFTPPVTRYDIVLQLVYWTGTAIFNVIGVGSALDASSRAGRIAIFNLVVLLFGDKLAFAADVMAMSRQTYLYLHQSMGTMTVVQMVAQIVLEWLGRGLRLQNISDRSHLIAAASMFAIFLLALPFPRNFFYEFFISTHYLLAAVVVYGVWSSLSSGFSQERIALILALGLHALLVSARISRIIYRNVSKGKGWTRAVITRRSGALEVQIDVPRGWKVQPNQYVYFCAPGVSIGSFFQRHPFSIAWWSEDDEGRATSVSLLIQPQNGFTSHLMNYPASQRRLLVGLDGPYGKAVATSQYGTVVLIATGIGIASLLPFMKRIIEEHKACRTAVRKISLVWQMEGEFQEDWAANWIQSMLLADQQTKMLRCALYVASDFKSDKSKYGEPGAYGERVKKLYAFADFQQIIDKELNESVGKTLVAVSAKPIARDEVKAAVLKNIAGTSATSRDSKVQVKEVGHSDNKEADEKFDDAKTIVGNDITAAKKEVDYLELSFQPSEERRLWTFKSPEVEVKGVI